MSLPKQLTQSFTKIRSLNIQDNLTKENVRQFVDLLNQSIPRDNNPVSYAIYCFNRTKYLKDQKRFVLEIDQFPPYDSMILWTDFKDILEAFKLEGKIFLGWDKSKNKYRGYILNNTTSSVVAPPVVAPPVVAPPVVAPPVVAPPVVAPPVVAPKETGDYSNEMDDDMDRVYEYMHRRINTCAQN